MGFKGVRIKQQQRSAWHCGQATRSRNGFDLSVSQNTRRIILDRGPQNSWVLRAFLILQTTACDRLSKQQALFEHSTYEGPSSIESPRTLPLKSFSHYTISPYIAPPSMSFSILFSILFLIIGNDIPKS